MPDVTVQLSGDLVVTRGEACTISTDQGVAFRIGLSDLGAAQKLEISQKAASVNSVGSFVSLPFPSNLRGRVFYLRVRTGGPLDVELTHATATVVVHPGVKLFLAEFTSTEQISAVRVKGDSSDFEWCAVGISV